MNTQISYVEDNGVAWITLDRPDKLNSFTADMFAQLRETMMLVQASSSIRALVLTGSGKGFCAGQDLQDLGDASLHDVLERDYNPLVRSLKSLNFPVIACVNGVAAGAGANLALACDIVLAARSAKFIQSFAHVGLVPDGGGTWSLPRLIGMPRAMALAMTAEPVSAEKAEQWGMIWRCIDDEDLIAQTTELAHKLASQATVGLAFTKQLLNASTTNTLDQQLDLERDFQHAAAQTSDYREGVAAFLGKRKPNFTGQ